VDIHAGTCELSSPQAWHDVFRSASLHCWVQTSYGRSLHKIVPGLGFHAYFALSLLAESFAKYPLAELDPARMWCIYRVKSSLRAVQTRFQSTSASAVHKGWCPCREGRLLACVHLHEDVDQQLTLRKLFLLRKM